MTRHPWIDTTKGICMLLVYLLHSEAYYHGSHFSVGRLVSPFYVNAFFFVSGYLFFASLMGGGISSIDIRRHLCKKAKAVVFRLVIPTILFSSLIYLPKMLFHAHGVGFGDYLFDVWGGISYWFTSALAVAQLVLLLIASLRIRDVRVYTAVTAVLFAVGVFLNARRPSHDASAFFPWFWKTAMVYTFVMTLGGVYRRYEHKIWGWMKYGWIVALSVYLGIVGWAPSIVAMGLGGRCNLAGFMAMLSSVMLLAVLTKRIGQRTWLEWIGRHSIVFYFFSGVFPAAVSAAASRMAPEGNYAITVIVAILSVLLGVIATYLVNRFAPWMLDLRRLKPERSQKESRS